MPSLSLPELLDALDALAGRTVKVTVEPLAADPSTGKGGLVRLFGRLGAVEMRDPGDRGTAWYSVGDVDEEIGNGFYVDASRFESAKIHGGVVQVIQEGVDLRLSAVIE